jgi:hypothetical protein
MFIFGMVLGFFLSFYYVIRKRLKETKEKDYGVRPMDVKEMQDLL